MKLGAIDFLQKPLRPEELRKVVAEIILRHQPGKQLIAPDDFEGHVTAAKRLINLRDFAAAKSHISPRSGIEWEVSRGALTSRACWLN